MENQQVTEEEARRWLAAVDASGLTVHAWCRANNMVPSTLYSWRRRLSAGTAASPHFVEVTSRPSASPVLAADGSRRAPPSSAARYELVFDNIRVVVGDDFLDDTLARLLRVARAC